LSLDNLSPNAFIGSTLPPTDAELSAALGRARVLWDELLAALALPVQEWHSYSPKAGWSLKLKLKKRTIVYLAPCVGRFRVAFTLGAKAIEATHRVRLSKTVRKIISEAPKYPEGTGVRMEITGRKDLAAVKKLAAVKLAN
jgi:hypothetical protein